MLFNYGLATLNFAIVIVGGTYLILTKQVSMATGLGLIVMFIEYSYTYFQPLTQLSSLYNLIELAITGAKRLAKVEQEKEEKRGSDGKQLSTLNQGLVLEDVHFGYDKDKEILHGINITVPKGKSVAIVGPTGSGKMRL
ncbi:lipid A export permease ATP-binding protein MsbA [Lactobacillus psittaci DSM 15354]|uniref:Lipid A export permease ATP-binding protein MsbA n=1 Tax=Lactobacillus psittaci DSM 15354 TaxID=1122152 RepID=A0A0R1S432_9LACO|nr:lipid A export permease ATP-binding protein MsbA [Lactobacillus psittaci DSM 15354]